MRADRAGVHFEGMPQTLDGVGEIASLEGLPALIQPCPPERCPLRRRPCSHVSLTVRRRAVTWREGSEISSHLGRFSLSLEDAPSLPVGLQEGEYHDTDQAKQQ